METASFPILVADIGGTNARFGLVGERHAPPSDVRILAGADYPSLAAALDAYLQMVGTARPLRGCIALAGPVYDGRFHLTNRPQWDTELEPLRRAFGFRRLAVINDFEALAEAVPLLGPSDLLPIGIPRQGISGAPIAVIGPGTGLGVGAAVKTPFGWQAVPGEGGHMELANPDARCRAAIGCVAATHDRVSAERLRSGPGLELLYVVLGEVDGKPRSALDATVIHDRAHAGDLAAIDTVTTFFKLLAGFAGDVALLLGARGGVFLAGGVTDKLASHLDGSAFRSAFEHKGRLAPYMQAIPTNRIVAELVGVRGCGAHIERLGFQREGRHA